MKDCGVAAFRSYLRNLGIVDVLAGQLRIQSSSARECGILGGSSVGSITQPVLEVDVTVCLERSYEV